MINIFDISRCGHSDISDFIKEYQGKKVHCQIHNDNNPSAYVYKDHIHCYSCGAHFFFDNPQYIKRSKIYKTNDEKAHEYHNSLLHSTNQSNIRKFLKLRGITDDIAKDFQLGFYDNSLVFPIKDTWKNINGFGFRQITDNTNDKYRNDKDKEKDDNSLFSKGNNLFGIDKLSDKCKHLILCEGYIDVISAYKNDFRTDVCVVAIMGTSFSDKNVSRIKYITQNSNVSRISLMLDNDPAGESATIRIIKKLLTNDIYPSVIFNFRKKADYKDIDELLKKKDGKETLRELLDRNYYDWCDYLIKKVDQALDNGEEKKKLLNEIKECIKLIKDNEIRGIYSSKLCSITNLYEKLESKSAKYPNILSLNKSEIKDFFLKEESYFNCKLPKYFTFKNILKWAETKLSTIPNFPYREFKKIENTNYKILGNKNGEYAWRKYQIINPILYVKLVNVIFDNWDGIKRNLEKNSKIETNIKCSSMPVLEKEKDRFSNNTARQIINWWDGMEQDSIKKSLKYRYVIQTDIVDCYGSIYTHSIAWALHGKNESKNNRENYNLVGNRIDSLLQCMNHGQTNGIPQGSTLMDFIAEILLHHIDSHLYIECKKNNITDYYILRYRDDYRIFANEISTAKRILKLLSEILVEVSGMRLSSEKTNTSDCIISGAIKKDKIHYFECFKEQDSLKKNILNIYLFAKKYPNSGSILKLLQLFSQKVKIRINEISRKIIDSDKIEEILKDFDTEYTISILSEIMYLHPRTYSISCSVIFDIMSIMKVEERNNIWKNIITKMQDVPNNELLHIWLERMVYINPNDTHGWHNFAKYCEVTNTLLYKSYSNDTSIWSFPNSINIDDLDISLILDENIKDKLNRAREYQIQRIDVNEPFTTDETNPFEYSN